MVQLVVHHNDYKIIMLVFGLIFDFTSPYTRGAAFLSSLKISDLMPDFFKIFDTRLLHSSIPSFFAEILGWWINVCRSFRRESLFLSMNCNVFHISFFYFIK